MSLAEISTGEKDLPAAITDLNDVCPGSDQAGRNQLLHPAHDEIDDMALQAHQIAHRGDDDLLHAGARDNSRDGGGKVLEHDEDGARTGIVELVFEFARRIERVDVDHDHAGAEDAADDDRILQDIRHHDGDAVALLQPLRLQPACHLARKLFQFRKCERLAHAVIGDAVRIAAAVLLDHVGERTVGRGGDRFGHARRIGLQPGSGHVRAVSLRCSLCHLNSHCGLPRLLGAAFPPACN